MCGVVVCAAEILAGEDEELADDAVVVAVCDILGDSVEGEDKCDGSEKKPCINKRRRTFHIV